MTTKRVDAAKALMAGMLCVLMVAPDAMAEAGTAAQRSPLTQSEKDLQALNRFTFGPRPGDEAMVRRMGLNAWFEQQLHPEKIDDSALDARLAEYPSLQLPIGLLMVRFPDGTRLKQMERTGEPLPEDPIERAIYADSMAFYSARLKAASKIETKTDATGDAMMAAGKQADGAGANAMAADSDLNAKGKRRKFDEPPMQYAEMQELMALPAGQRFGRLVAMSPQEMVSLRLGMKGFAEARLVDGMTPVQKEDVIAMQGGERVIGAEALEARLLRDVYSQRQLQAVMDDFWLNHFSVYVRKNQIEPYMLASYERNVILPNAMGKFETLLDATAGSPAMLMYLDNWESIGPHSLAATRAERFGRLGSNAKRAQNAPKGINENYGRELMELHTLGVGGGYTQQDVIEVAKCFTGWTISRPYGGGGGGGGRRFGPDEDTPPGQAVFDPTKHEPGTKIVLGHTIKEGGMNEGLEVLHILATSPATAHHISYQLAERFVSDDPPPALVSAMAATFLKSDGDIKAVLTTMFRSPLFWSPAVYRDKVKTPIEFMVSALRASDADVKNPLPLVQAMAGLGMPIYGMLTPNGYAWTADHWVSSNSLVSRMNFALILSGSRVPGTTVNWLDVLGDSADPQIATAPTDATEASLEHIILGEPAGADTRHIVLANYNDPTMQRQAAANFAKTSQGTDEDGAMTGAPRFRAAIYGKMNGKRGDGQRYLSDKPETPLDTMAGLLLGSPDFQKR
jgi:uncharacterized protein (DUF1800 family)